MQVGDLVRKKKNTSRCRIGIIWAIGSPNPIARILWRDGRHGATHIKFLEVVK